MTTYEEWRVTGVPRRRTYEQIFINEDSARAFMANASAPCDWVDGPHLHRRTVTVTEWREAGPPPVNRPHPTCRDVTGIDQTPRSEWICGPECPKEA